MTEAYAIVFVVTVVLCLVAQALEQGHVSLRDLFLMIFCGALPVINVLVSLFAIWTIFDESENVTLWEKK